MIDCTSLILKNVISSDNIFMKRVEDKLQVGSKYLEFIYLTKYPYLVYIKNNYKSIKINLKINRKWAKDMEILEK